MPTIRIDDNAHKILVDVKKKMKQSGIKRPTLSDAVRYLSRV